MVSYNFFLIKHARENNKKIFYYYYFFTYSYFYFLTVQTNQTFKCPVRKIDYFNVLKPCQLFYLKNTKKLSDAWPWLVPFKFKFSDRRRHDINHGHIITYLLLPIILSLLTLIKHNQTSGS